LKFSKRTLHPTGSYLLGTLRIDEQRRPETCGRCGQANNLASLTTDVL